MPAGIKMSVQFNQIPPSVRVPGAYMEVDNTEANSAAPTLWRRILIIGQMLATGSQTPCVPLQITGGKAQSDAAFGQGSMLTAMVAAARAANTYTEMWAIGLSDNNAGTASVWTVTYAGSATQALTQNLYIGGVQVQIAVTVGMTAAQAAAAVQAAIAANPDLPVTATVAAGVVTITARHKGADAGTIDIRNAYYSGDAIAQGLTVTIAETTTGSGNPALTPAIVAMGDDWYHDIVQPYSDAANIALMTAEAARRFGPLLQKGGRVYSWWNGTMGTLGTQGNSVNDPNLAAVGLQNCPSPAYVNASVLAAVCSYSLAIDPAVPLRTLALPGVVAPAPQDQFTWTNRNLLLQEGVATVTVDRQNMVHIERMITTYKVNAAGAPDTSYLQLETMATIDYLRYSWDVWMLTKFPRVKVANDSNQPPPAGVVTPNIIAQEQVCWFVTMMNLGLVQNLAQFKAQQVVVRNSGDPTRVDTLLPPELVSGLQVIAGKLRFLF